MTRYLVAIDQGTTSSRCIVFSPDGQIVSSAQMEHKQIYPQPGWVEHDPMEIWQAVKQVVGGALGKESIPPDEVAAIGITNQRETVVVWDKASGEPLYNAIVWQDTRTDQICAELAREGGMDRFRPITGLPLATYFSGPKLKWLMDNLPGLRQRAEAGEVLFGTIDTWLLWNLSGGTDGGLHLTDVTNASRTLMMNLQTLDWDEDMLRVLGVPRAMLPTIRPSAQIYGSCALMGLEGVPLAAILGDQQAALFGQTCFEPGEAKNTYGTGCFMLMNTGETAIQSQNGLLTTLGYQIENQPPVYALEGSIAITGALVQWLRDNLGIIRTAADVESLALSVQDNGGIYFVPAFSGLFAPYWRSDARGAIVGLTRFINAGHIARAVLESTAYQTREILEAMNKDSGVDLSVLKVDGGMVANQTLMQFQSDILGVPVRRSAIAETTALGAAYAAGLAVGLWASPSELRSHWRCDREWTPQLPETQRDALYAGWKKAVTRTFNWVEV